MDVSHAKSSPFGQYILSQAGPAANLDKLKAATGFDPRTDLLEIAAGSGTNGAALVVGFGAFPIARLTTMAQISGTPTSAYRGLTLISAGNAPATPLSKGPPVETVAVFLDGSTFAMGGADLVKGGYRSMDRRRSRYRSIGRKKYPRSARRRTPGQLSRPLMATNGRGFGSIVAAGCYGARNRVEDRHDLRWIGIRRHKRNRAWTSTDAIGTRCRRSPIYSNFCWQWADLRVLRIPYSVLFSLRQLAPP